MEVKTWGKAWHPSLPRSRDNRCPNCGESSLARPDLDFFKQCGKYIVGFEDNHFNAVFGCPDCGYIFCFHFDPVFAKWFFEDFVEPAKQS
jgi:predicted RNA-binding Zn-ribbon protein involved in translation (DUF1610 family)